MFKSVLVPVDLSDPDHFRDAIDTAVGMCKAFGTHLRLVTVIPPLPGVVAEYMPVETHAEVLSQTQDKLNALLAETGIPAEQSSTGVREGSVYHEVLEEAQESQSDLIVMGSHRPGMRTYLLGSNAARIVRHAPCSVMVLRGED